MAQQPFSPWSMMWQMPTQIAVMERRLHPSKAEVRLVWQQYRMEVPQLGTQIFLLIQCNIQGLVDHQVAVVVFSVVLNKDVTNVTNLTSQQITDMYTGKITNWKDVGGPNLPIITIYRKAGSGTRVTFDTYVLHGATEKTDAASINADSSGDLATIVAQTSGGIAYVATSYAQAKKLPVIKIDGVNDSVANVKDNTYKFWNVEHIYTRGQPSGLAKAFIDYMSSNNSEVASARKKDGFLVLSDLAQAAINAKQPK